MNERPEELFTEKQWAVRNFDVAYRPRITLLEGAIRTGKTRVLIWLWVAHIARLTEMGLRNAKFIMTGYTIPSLKKNVLDDMMEMFDIDTSLNLENQFKFMGHTICCFGADKHHSYKAMRGMTAFGWLGNEITLQHPNTYKEAMNRCSGKGARIFLDTNPDSPEHFIYKELILNSGARLASGRINIISHHFRLDDNTFLDKEYVESLKATTPSGMWYDRNIEGKWVAAEGIIYQDFVRSKHVIRTIPKLTGDYCGVDWGYEHHGCILWFGKDMHGNDYIIDETYEQHQGMDFWVPQAKRITEEVGYVPFWCDTARPEFIAEFRKNKINAKDAKKEVIEGIASVASAFKMDKLFIHERCVNTIREIQSYIWKPTGLKEVPMETNDDAMDAMRYGYFSQNKKAQTIVSNLKTNTYRDIRS